MILVSFEKGEEKLGPNYKFRQEWSRSDLAKIIVLYEYPFSIVKHIGFKTFSHTIKSDILEMYRKEKKKLHKVLDKIPSRIILISHHDIWPSCRNQGYLCLTTHYIDDVWLMQKRVCSFAYVLSSHTGDVVIILMDLFMQ
ncbi:hypothetical protein AMTRI_Chr07g79360 [Amborella trichopoda]